MMQSAGARATEPGGVAKRTTAPVSTTLPAEERVEPEKCRLILNQLERMGPQRNRFQNAAWLVELKARGCSNDPANLDKDIVERRCDNAMKYWHEVGSMKEDDMKRLLLAAGCEKLW